MSGKKRASIDGDAAAGIASMIEQIARRLTSMKRIDGLHPSQWSALRFFETADEPARTTSGLAAFQAVNAATASRTISTLLRDGYLDERLSTTDRRVRYIDLTQKGRTTLDDDPFHSIRDAIATLDRERLDRLAVDLPDVFRALSAIDRTGE